MAGVWEKLGRLTSGRPGALHPADVLSSLETAAEKGKKHFLTGTMAPDTYAVLLHPEDLDELRPLLPSLEQELVHELALHLERREYHLNAPQPRITFQAQKDLPPGRVTVEARFTKPLERREHTVTLRVLEPGAKAPREIRLGPGEHVLGRGRSADVVLGEDTLLSRAHCLLRIAPGGVSIRDLESANGTFRNHARIRQEELLDPGDRIQVGSTEIEVTW